MPTSVQALLSCDHLPENYYKLLGLRCFDPRRELAVKSIRTYLRELIPFQNHSDKAIAEKAIHLCLELGRAEEVFSDRTRLASYEAELARTLRSQYYKRGAAELSVKELRAWLESEQHVYPDRVRALLQFFASPHLTDIQFEVAEASAADAAPTARKQSTDARPRSGQAPSRQGQPTDSSRRGSVFGATARPLDSPSVGQSSSSDLAPVAPQQARTSPESLAPVLLEPVPRLRGRSLGLAIVAVIGLLVILNGVVIWLRFSAVPSENEDTLPDVVVATEQSLPAESEDVATPEYVVDALPEFSDSSNRFLPAMNSPPVADRPNKANPARTTVSTISRNRKRPGSEVLIVSEEDGAMAFLANDTWEVVDASWEVPGKIMAALTDSLSVSWIAGSTGLLRIEGEHAELMGTRQGLPAAPLAHLLEDSKGRIWGSSWGGGVAMLMDGVWQTFTTKDGLRHPDVNACVEDRAGRIWVMGSAGMEVGGRGVTIFQDGGMEQGGIGEQLVLNVMSADADPSGRLFLGCVGGLLIVHPDLSTQQLTVKDGLPQRTPQATLVDSQGRIWLGTWGGGVVQVNNDTFKIMPDRTLKDAGFVRRIAEDAQGTIWAAGQQGLWKFKDGTWKQVTIPQSFNRLSVVTTVPVNVKRVLVKGPSGL